MKKLLLHCCCAPCANQPIDLLLADGYKLQLFYSNSNIHPEQEFIRRRDCMVQYAGSLGLDLYQDEYRRGEWFSAIGDDGGVFTADEVVGEEHNHEMIAAWPHVERDAEILAARRQLRCRLCYRYRFARLAEEARRLDIGLIASTLAVSPYQYHDILAEELQVAAENAGVEALYVDWREHYRAGQDRARQLGLYRQKYCGCEFSRQEADIERAARSKMERQA